MLRRWWIEVGWTAMFVVVAFLGLLTSEGEPVCEGPFIWSRDDSSPPQCPSPLDALPDLAIAWVVGLAVILAARVLRRLWAAAR
jgi:hypothetical protein